MANPEHLKILERGVKEWNKWRKEKMYTRPDLSWVNLDGANLGSTNFQGANLQKVAFGRTDLSKTDLRKANLQDAYFFGATLTSSKLCEADLQRTDFGRADLSKTDLRRANLQEANLHKADLSSAILNNALLTSAQLGSVNLRGANLSSANLSRANLQEANLSWANLQEGSLQGANLNNANLQGANLSNANLQGANLSNANLQGANLSNANLSEAYLDSTIFTQSKLNETTFNDAALENTIFGLNDLSTCIGLDSVRVSGECVIDFQTLEASKNLPKSFLFKIGLPETYIEYLPDFYDEKPLRLFPVFISHSSADKEFTGKLYEALIKRRVRVWYDKHKLKPGDDILDSVDKGINVYDKMILVCSKSSLDSWWVEEELERIFEKERQYRKEHGKKHRLLIPITIDDEILNSKAHLAKSIRKRSIGKFQGWQDEQQFNKALKDLIAALNADRGDDEPLSFL